LKGSPRIYSKDHKALRQKKEEGVVTMVVKSMIRHGKDDIGEVLELAVLVERLKRLRALNKDPESIGLTQYKWRSFSIDKTKEK